MTDRQLSAAVTAVLCLALGLALIACPASATVYSSDWPFSGRATLADVRTDRQVLEGHHDAPFEAIRFHLPEAADVTVYMQIGVQMEGRCRRKDGRWETGATLYVDGRWVGSTGENWWRKEHYHTESINIPMTLEPGWHEVSVRTRTSRKSGAKRNCPLLWKGAQFNWLKVHVHD